MVVCTFDKPPVAHPNATIRANRYVHTCEPTRLRPYGTLRSTSFGDETDKKISELRLINL